MTPFNTETAYMVYKERQWLQAFAYYSQATANKALEMIATAKKGKKIIYTSDAILPPEISLKGVTVFGNIRVSKDDLTPPDKLHQLDVTDYIFGQLDLAYSYAAGSCGVAGAVKTLHDHSQQIKFFAQKE